MSRFRAVVALLAVLLLFAGAAFGIGALLLAVTDTDAHRAFGLGFYGLGGVLVFFALVTHGAEGRAWGPDTDAFLVRLMGVPDEDGRSLNPTGVFSLAGVLLVALGVVFDAALA